MSPNITIIHSYLLHQRRIYHLSGFDKERLKMVCLFFKGSLPSIFLCKITGRYQRELANHVYWRVLGCQWFGHGDVVSPNTKILGIYLH